jgi:hypothetical protein
MPEGPTKSNSLCAAPKTEDPKGKRTINTNISFQQHGATFASMHEHMNHILRAFRKGDTSGIESFFRRPGGRKYLENLTLILINTLPHQYEEKEELYLGFVEVLDQVEQHLRQKEGGEILEGIFRNN